MVDPYLAAAAAAAASKPVALTEVRKKNTRIHYVRF